MSSACTFAAGTVSLVAIGL